MDILSLVKDLDLAEPLCTVCECVYTYYYYTTVLTSNPHLKCPLAINARLQAAILLL